MGLGLILPGFGDLGWFLLAFGLEVFLGWVACVWWFAGFVAFVWGGII